MSDRLRTVLSVEDELLVHMSAVDHLQEVGFQVIEAATADDALGVLDVRSEEVDVLFSDIDMPGTLDGIALAERVASVWPRMQIVLCSGKIRNAESSCVPDGFIASLISRPLSPSTFESCCLGLRSRRTQASRGEMVS